MRTIAAIIVIIAGALPALFAGRPGVAPGWFDGSWLGAPLSVVAMCALMLFLVCMSVVCSEASKGKSLPTKGDEY